MTKATSTFSAASGDGYELQMGRWSRRLASGFLDFAGLTDAGCVLDAGCGTGALSAELLKRTESVRIVAVDISPEYIDHAAASMSEKRISFETGDLTSLRFPDAMFDQVFAQLVLHFVPQTMAAVNELVRVAKPASSVSAAVWDARGGLTFNRLFLDTAAMLDPAASDLRGRNFTRPLTRPNELENTWRAVGLVDLKSGEATIRTDFSSFDDYWAPFDGDDGPIPAYLRTITPRLRERIKDAVRQAYIDGEDDGPRSYTATAWVVRGVKPVAATTRSGGEEFN